MNRCSYKETEECYDRGGKIQIEQEVEDGSCEFMHVHEEIVEKVEGVMPDEQQLLDLSEFF